MSDQMQGSAGPLNAAQVAAVQQAIARIQADMGLRKWCIDVAAQVIEKAPAGTRLIDLASQVHEFVSPKSA